MKLKTKMAWTIACSVLIVLVLLVAMFFAFSALFLSGYNHVKLRDMSAQLGQRLERAHAVSEEQLTRELRQFGSEYEGVGMELFASDGTLLYSSANRTAAYSLQEMMTRLADQPYRMFRGLDSTFLYEIAANGQRYFAAFDVKGNALQQVQIFLYFNQYASFPFLIVPLILIIVLPAAVAFLFILFVTRRLGRLNDAMRHADLRQEPVRLRDESGDEIGALTRLFNEMSAKLHRQYARTRRIEQSRTRLIGSLSHDLRTPLAIVRGYAETLQRGSVHDPDVRVRHAAIIVQKSEYMNGLLGQLFRLAELDDPSAAFRFERGSVNALLQSIAAEYVLVLKDQGIEWQLELPEADIRLDYDQDSMAQALRNLIDNAISHGRDGSYLGIRMDTGNESARIAIEDRGKGIPAEELDRVFERFYRVDKGRRGDGLGIGLSLANEIVRQHGGSIAVRSVPHERTVFTVSLPLTRESKL